MPTKVKKIEKAEMAPVFHGVYIEAVGSRKRSLARVRLYEENGEGPKAIIINGRSAERYFPTEEMRLIALDALNKTKVSSRFSVSAHIKGGGIHAQAEALRHGISRALIKVNEEWRKKLKRSGYLKRDPREKERRKFGLKKARKAPQWSKR